MRKSIRIENPLSGCGFTLEESRQAVVKHGLAQWVEFGVSIRFVRDPRDHRDQSALQNVEVPPYCTSAPPMKALRLQRRLANTPVVASGILLGLGKRKGASRHTFLATQSIA